MPIATGATGRPLTRAIPGDRFLQGKPFRSAPFSTANTKISGVTKDSTGAALASCVVKLMRTGGDTLAAQMTSDGAGVFAFDNPGSGPFYLLATKPGSPDVAGLSLNTLVAT